MAGLLGSQPQYGLLGPGMSPGLLGRQPYDPANETYWTPQTAGSPSLGIDETNYQWGDYSNQPGDIARFFMGKPPVTPEQEAQLRTSGGGEGTAALGLGANMLPGGGIADYFFGTPGMGGRNFGDNVMAGEWGEAGGQLLGLGADALYGLNPLAAIFAGVAAKTADMGKLAKAKKLAEAGTDPAKIWTDTGWFKGVDDQWRFEIPDDGAGVVSSPLRPVERYGVGGRVQDNFHHPELYQAYDLPTEYYARSGPRGGSAEPSTTWAVDVPSRGVKAGDIDDPGRITVKGRDAAEIDSVSLHELQHVIQNEEGFARGGNMSDEAARLAAARDSAMVNDVMSSLDPAVSAKMRRYEEIRKTWAARQDEMPRELVEEVTALKNDPAVKAGFAKVKDAVAEIRSKGQGGALEGGAVSREDAFRQYQRLAGETEARNVEARRYMTPEERLASPPWETQDVPNDQQIVRFGGEGPQASVGDKPRVFYRGTNPGDERRIKTGNDDWDSHLFASSDPEQAKMYGRELETIEAKPDAKIIYEGTKDWVKTVGKWRKDENLLEYADRAAKAAREAGYDAAWFKMQGNVGTAIFNPNAFKRGNQPLARTITNPGRTGRPIETKPFSTAGDKAIMDAAMAKVEPNIPMAPPGIKAYHGSPHDGKVGGMTDAPKAPKRLYRGIVEGEQADGSSGLGTAHLGKGLYTSRDKSFAKKYAVKRGADGHLVQTNKVVEVDPATAWPKRPLVLDGAGGAESLLLDYVYKTTDFKNAREFNKAYPERELFLKERGFDGVIAGDEVVKY